MNTQPELNVITPTFNLINVMRLRDHLVWLGKKESKPKVGFNMMYYHIKINRKDAAGICDESHHSCNTVACLAGHAAILSNKFCQNNNISSIAKRWLGLKEEEAMYLFSGSFTRKYIQDITLDDAITELNFMIQNGRTSGVFCP